MSETQLSGSVAATDRRSLDELKSANVLSHKEINNCRNACMMRRLRGHSTLVLQRKP
jgi:hypothetical protein